MTFEFATAGRILFGEGVLGSVGALASELGSRVLVVTAAPQSGTSPCWPCSRTGDYRSVPFPSSANPRWQWPWKVQSRLAITASI